MPLLRIVEAIGNYTEPHVGELWELLLKGYLLLSLLPANVRQGL